MSSPLLGRWLLSAVVVAAAFAHLADKQAFGHPISVTDAVVRVSQTQADVQITVFLEDLYLFHDLQPNEKDFLELKAIARGAELHKKFLMERFVIRDAKGERIAAKYISTEQPELPKQGVPLAELMSYKLSYHFRYAMQDAPEFLTISQNLVDAEVSIPAETRLVIQQAGTGVAFTAALTTEEPQTVRFDWKGKPLAKQPTPEQLQAWFDEQRKQTLGITSYSSVYSFLYIEDGEVRHEILMPLLSLSKSIPMPRKDEDFLEVDEQDALQAKIEEHFRSGNPIVVDGKTLEGSVSRLDYFGVERKDFAKLTDRTRVSMASARVGVILNYPVSQAPRKLDLTWDRFNPVIYTVQLTVYTDEKAEKKTLSKIGGRNQFHWESSIEPKKPFASQLSPVQLEARERWSFPLVTMAIAIVGIFYAARTKRRRWLVFVIIGVALACWPLLLIQIPNPLQSKPRVSASDAEQIVEGVLRNAYGAFGLRDETASYDALAASVDGELLRNLYLQIRQGMIHEQQGGAVARVREIQPISGQFAPLATPHQDERAFSYRLAWTVQGDVEHWGHKHSRTNRYDAVFTLKPRGAYWCLTGLDVLEEKRVKSQTDIRRLKNASSSP